MPPPGTTVPPALYQAYRATSNYVSPDGRTVQYSTSLKAGDPGSTSAMNAVPSIRAETTAVAKSIGAADSAVGGEAPAIYDISSISNSDLKHIIPIAILAIGILLALVLRSLIAPLYLIASVGVSYLAALGLSVLIFIKAGHSGGLVFFMPFLMFIFLLALGEDYNILVMTRIREEAQLHPLREAVRRALSRTGTTVTSAGLVLAGTFLVLTIVAGSSSGGEQIRDIGLGLALGILMDTFLVRTLLVPSTVVLLGRWNWWPSKMSRISAELPAGRPALAAASEPAAPPASGPAAPGRPRGPRTGWPRTGWPGARPEPSSQIRCTEPVAESRRLAVNSGAGGAERRLNLFILLTDAHMVWARGRRMKGPQVPGPGTSEEAVDRGVAAHAALVRSGSRHGHGRGVVPGGRLGSRRDHLAA